MGNGFDGKVMVVAGAGSGIGADAARVLADGGARVVVADCDAGRAAEVRHEIVSRGGHALPVTFDIADQDSVRMMFAETVAAFGRVDGLFNVAADMNVLDRDTDLLNMDLGVWDRTLAIDLRGYVLTIREAVPLMQQSGGGAIVNTSSGAAFVGEAKRPAYASAKAAILALTRHVAARWGRSGIRCNAVAPGLVRTERAFHNAAELWERALAANPSGRLGVPSDISAAVAFLLGDESSWINGQTLNVDGGTVMR